jgi:soluble lytic murein transglycosylase-like protein
VADTQIKQGNPQNDGHPHRSTSTVIPLRPEHRVPPRGTNVYGWFGAALAVVAAFWLGHLRQNQLPPPEQARLAWLEAEVTRLTDENYAIKVANAEGLERERDLQFMVAHATLRLRDLERTPAPYDFDKFVERNPETRKYFPYLQDAVRKYEKIWPVDPTFALAIMQQESEFGRFTVSKAGALGDAQFIESTANLYGMGVREPITWKNGRQYYRDAANRRRQARDERDRFMRDIFRGATEQTDPTALRALLTKNFPEMLPALVRFREQNAEADLLDQKGNAAYTEYKSQIDQALAHAKNLEASVRLRQEREERLITVSGLRPKKTRAEKDAEVALIVNDYLAGVDPRLAPILYTDALVHHLADLFAEFKGDRRLVAARYNASRGAMEAAVARLGGGVGIPLLDETQDYVNKVVVRNAFLAADAGVLEHLDVSCCVAMVKQ